MRGDTDFWFCTYTCTELTYVPLCCHFATYYSFPGKKSVLELNDQPTYDKLGSILLIHPECATWGNTYVLLTIHIPLPVGHEIMYNIKCLSCSRETWISTSSTPSWLLKVGNIVVYSPMWLQIYRAYTCIFCVLSENCENIWCDFWLNCIIFMWV